MLLIYDQLRTSVLKEAVELDDGQKQYEHKELKLKIFPLSENLWMKSWSWLSLTLQDAIVGLPRVTGVSTEQRKRLNVAVELVANPSVIFMDEPTSGLDARAAAIVMRTARITADTGRTVVCIFESFDESIPGVPKIMDKYNPARWMLEASSIATDKTRSRLC